MTTEIKPRDLSLLFVGGTVCSVLPNFPNRDIDSSYLAELARGKPTLVDTLRYSAYGLAERFSKRHALLGFCARGGFVSARGFMFAKQHIVPGRFQGEFQGHIYGIHLGTAPFSVGTDGGNLLLSIDNATALEGKLSGFYVASGIARTYDGASMGISQPGRASVLVTPYGGLQFSGITTINFTATRERAA